MNSTTRDKRPVIIADSQFLVTETLRHLLEGEGFFRVAGITASKAEVVKLCRNEPDALIIIDPQNCDILRAEELASLQTFSPDRAILVLTHTVTPGLVKAYSKAGIRNVILKNAGKEEILEAVSAACAGKKYYSGEIIDLLLAGSGTVSPALHHFRLTETEKEIVRLIAYGCTTKEIAGRKNISFHTVVSHRKNIFRKLGVSHVSELVLFASRNGLTESPEYYI